MRFSCPEIVLIQSGYIVVVFISSWYFGALQVASVLGVLSNNRKKASSQTVNRVFCACELAS